MCVLESLHIVFTCFVVFLGQERLALQMPELLLGPLQHLDLETPAGPSSN